MMDGPQYSAPSYLRRPIATFVDRLVTIRLTAIMLVAALLSGCGGCHVWENSCYFGARPAQEQPHG